MKKVNFQGKKFRIITETIRKDKKVKIMEYCQRNSSVIVLVVTKDNKTLLIKENRPERGGWCWGLPSGGVERREEKKPIIAAKRELNEEVNLVAKKIKLFFVSKPSGSIKWKRYVYIVENFIKTNNIAKKDDDEEIKTCYLSFAKALTLALDGSIKNETAALAIIRYLSKKRRLLVK
ncbi:MAG: NUDIX hydrolase [Candidatus Staskawiczbacteria bacterium]|nr:NUDIX hydrolase [Candidatus Staskawiczbacteria bacterium]